MGQLTEPLRGDVGKVKDPTALTLSETPVEVRMAITDTGPGIVPEHQQRIFEKFGQVEDRQNRQGTGLAFTFCKLALEAHGGRIGVERIVGQDNTFWLTLPRLNGSPGTL